MAGMAMRTMVDNDVAAYGRICPHCGQGYAENRLVFEPPNQAFSIHASCLKELAESIPPAALPQDRSHAAINARYQQALIELDAEAI